MIGISSLFEGTPMENNTDNKISKLLQNLSNYLLSATIICYISGFAITNLYLGSLGVVNLDILRSRYILTGILFIVFAGAILYLLFGLQKIIKENAGKSQIDTLKKGLSFSFENLIIIYVAVPVIAIFAGSANRITPILPQANPEIDWLQWLTTEPVKIFPASVFTFFVILASIALVFVTITTIVIILNPKEKDGSRSSRKEKLRKLFAALTNDVNYKKIIGNLLIVFIGLDAVFLLSSIMKLLRTGEITSNITTKLYFQMGWSRFFIAIVIVYTFIAILLLIMSSTARQPTNEEGGDNEKESSKNIVSQYFSWIYVLFPTVATIISVYAFGVYPYLPQQIGGGRLIPVEVSSISEDIKATFITQTNDVYLIDRAPSSSLFLVVDQITDKYKIVEVPNNLIESVVFYESP
jgi:hypothetical protein